MNYCFVACNYPTKKRQVHVFLENVVVRLVNKGENCVVIAPQSIYSYLFKKNNRRKLVEERITNNGKKYMVYSPLYFVFPKLTIGRLHFRDLSCKMIYKSIKRVYKKQKLNLDIVYAHFIESGIPAVKFATEYNIPSFIANGEADTIDSLKYNSTKVVNDTLKNVNGIISVSTKNRNEIKQLCNNDKNIMKKVKIIVNAVDENRFHKMSQRDIRKKHGWPENAFIVAFTGSFIERKGILKLSNVLDKIGNIYSLFMGVGEQQPTCKNILFSGKVDNVNLAEYLNAADVFVLPTLAEGCSNAIVEAICCGLPIISSNLEFNYDILDQSCAILINPNNEDEIENAIRKIINDKSLREKLQAGSLKRSKQLSLNSRVEKIQDFICSNI